MKIIETNIPDVTSENIDKNKESIADSIIQNVYPLFDEVYQAKVEQVVSLKRKVKLKREEMKNEKDTMNQLMTSYKREQKISKILERVEKLVASGLAYDPTTKHETVILLKIIDKLPNDKLDQQLSKTIQTLNKRFSG